MSSYRRKLRDLSGNYVFPATRSTCVYLDDNQTLQEWIDSQSDSSGIDILDVYPVGSIYMNDTSSTSPATLFGGTWERIYERFLFGVSQYTWQDYQVGATGGEEKHRLNINEMPIHDHNPTTNSIEYTIHDISKYHVDNDEISTTTSAGAPRLIHRASSSSKKKGGGQAHNNMPPYYCVYMWKRVS